MKNLSLAFEVRLAVYLPLILLAAYAAENIASGDAVILGASVWLIAGVFGWLAHRRVRRQLRLLSDMGRVLKQAHRGFLEHRVTGIGSEDEMGRMAWLLNEMLDQTEACIRESITSTAYISRGRFHRPALALGLHGEFAAALRGINAAGEQVGITLHALDRVMGALHHGDFSARMDERVADKFRLAVDAAMDNMAQAMEQTRLALGGAASGDFSPRITLHLDGELQRMKTDCNAAMAELQQSVDCIVTVSEQLAAGDLSGQVDGRFHGDLLRVKNALNSGLQQLATTMMEILCMGEEVKNSAQQLADGDVDLAQRTEEQAASIEQTAATMEEMTSTVRGDAGRAASANELAQDTLKLARSGTGVMDSAMQSVERIHSNSEQMAAIVKLIDDIAFQTNLLALNAAVEAARAGEQGRGFAVVAGEVRTLAQRCGDSAREIRELIEQSVSNAQDGKALVNEAGESFRDIVTSVEQVSGIVSDIATSSSEQATGIEQVGKAMSQLDSVNQQNAALVEEMAAASANLKAQAEDMARQIGRFKLPDEKRGEPRSAMA